MSDTSSKKEQIRKAVHRLLEDAGSKGIRTSDVHRMVREQTKVNLSTIQGNWHKFSREEKAIDKGKDNKIVEMDIGLYRLSKFDNQAIDDIDEDFQDNNKKDLKDRGLHPEQAYYKPFAQYLEDEDKCTDAISLEGKLFNGKWANPDVIGFKAYDNSFSRSKIISAEVKTSESAGDILKGFGQCCSYKLFSHKVYLVIPSSVKIMPRISALCIRHNIGLVTFDLTDAMDDVDWGGGVKNEPYFEEPDYDFVDTMFDKMKEDATIKKIISRYK